jgi:ABC-type nitrate/sulfonate/bicarbonate transport system substrate-binding protein
VTAASGITEPAQLRGRKVAISSPTGSSTIQTQYVLSKLDGLDTRLQGGDITFQPTAPEVLVSVLNNGGVDAATNLNKPRYLLDDTQEYGPVVHVSQDVHKALGAYPVTTVLATYPEVERDRSADLTKLTTALRTSVDYARSHKQELAGEVGGANPGDVDYLNWWWSTTDPKYGSLTQQDVAEIKAFWTMANVVGQLADVPTFDTLRSAAAPTQ